MTPNRNKKLSPLSYHEINAAQSLAHLPLPWTFTSIDQVEIIGSCNGLIALYRHPGDFCLFNPCTAPKDNITIHVPMDQDECRPQRVLYGLCFDSVNHDYKAVLWSLRSFDVQSFYVVNFKNGSWKLKTQTQMQNLGSWRNTGISGTIVRNVPYWVCKDIVINCYLIFYFDSKRDKFVEAPRVPNGEVISGLGTLDGQLTESLKSELGMEVWCLKEHGNGEWCWSMMFVITYKFSVSLSTLTWMVKEEEVLVDANEAELMVYNVKDGSLRKLKRRMTRSLYNMTAYLPSFISLI